MPFTRPRADIIWIQINTGKGLLHLKKMYAKIRMMPADIAAMRGSGMEWGQIAQELGIHPGSLGLTHAKGVFSQHKSDMMPATSRDLKGGDP